MWCYVWKCPTTKSAAPLYFIIFKNAVFICSQLRHWKLKLCMVEPLTFFPNPPAINLVRNQLGVLSWGPLECVCNGDNFSLFHLSSSYILAFLFAWHFHYFPNDDHSVWCSITASLLASSVYAVQERFSDSVDWNSFIALSFSAFIMLPFEVCKYLILNYLYFLPASVNKWPDKEDITSKPSKVRDGI